MAMNVFGIPITISTLQGMVEYANKKEKEITRLDMAKVALNMKNARGNDFNVNRFVESIGHEMQEDPRTYCVLYNATGGTLQFVTSCDWNGHLGSTPFPFTIANGQWAGFMHLNPLGIEEPSKGAVVYRGMNNKGQLCDFVFSWNNPCNRGGNDENKAFTEVRGVPFYEMDGVMGTVKRLLDTEGQLCHTCTWDNCFSSVSIGNFRKGVFVEAICTLEDANDV